MLYIREYIKVENNENVFQAGHVMIISRPSSEGVDTVENDVDLDLESSCKMCIIIIVDDLPVVILIRLHCKCRRF